MFNKEQHHIVMYNRAWCKSYIDAARHGENERIQNFLEFSMRYWQESCCSPHTKGYVLLV